MIQIYTKPIYSSFFSIEKNQFIDDKERTKKTPNT